MVFSEDPLELTQDAEVQSERLAKLAACAQVRPVKVLAEQEGPEPVTVGIALEHGADLQDQLAGIGRSASDVHGDGDLHGQGQYLEVVLA